MPDRYFTDEPIADYRATLTGAEAHHLIHVMRAEPGLEVTLFDGRGEECLAVVERIERNTVRLSIVARHKVDRELPLKLTLGVALPKGDRQRWLIEKATELGVARITPLLTRRAVSRPTEQTIKKLRRAVVEASKQCGRNRLMQINPPATWLDFITQTAGETNRLLAHPGLERSNVVNNSGTAYTLAIGPEGGFTEAEVSEAIKAGWQGIDLGHRTLRIETATLFLASIIIWESL